MIIAVAVLLLSPSGAPGPAFTLPAAAAASAASGETPRNSKGTSGEPIPLSPGTSVTQPSKTSVSKPTTETAAKPASSIEASPVLNISFPPPPTFRPQTEPLQRPSRAWFALMAMEHSAAGFDAWSTRRAVSQGRVEADPLMRPFANSGAIYGAIQIVPLGLDYFARRMQRSSGWTRHVWWVPQSVATASFLFSGSYNFSHTR